MTIESEMEPDEERAYLERRVANLEVIVCELLVKNERLRRELQATGRIQLGDRALPAD